MYGRIASLLEYLDDTLAERKTRFCIRVEIAAELCKRLQLAILRIEQLKRSRDLLHRLELSAASDTRYRDTGIYSRHNARMEQLGLEEYLTVGNRNYVCRDISRNIARLSLDYRQCGYRASAVLRSNASGTLEQARMEIEYVSRISLSSRRTADKQRECAVGDSMLAQIVINDEHISALLAKILRHSAARIRCYILQRCTLGGTGGNNDGIRHSARSRKLILNFDDRCILLSYRNIDAYNILIALIDNGINSYLCLTRLAVSDDKLTLSASYRYHAVDSLDTRLQRHRYTLSLDYSGCLSLYRAGLC